jgi:hypothetical protein
MNTFFNKKLVSTLTMLAVFTLLVSSCKKEDIMEPVVYGDANIRVVNTVSGSSAQDFYQGTSKLSTSAIAYGEATAYLKMKAGNSTISFKNAVTAATTATQNIGAETNNSYTAFYLTSATGSGQIIGFQDDTTAPSAGKAKVRFVNVGSAFNNNLNINITGGAAVTSGLQYSYASVYNTIDATATLSVQVIGSTAVAIPTVFQSGKIYTIWFDATSSTSANAHVITQN